MPNRSSMKTIYVDFFVFWWAFSLTLICHHSSVVWIFSASYRRNHWMRYRLMSSLLSYYYCCCYCYQQMSSNLTSNCHYRRNLMNWKFHTLIKTILTNIILNVLFFKKKNLPLFTLSFGLLFMLFLIFASFGSWLQFPFLLQQFFFP